MMYRDTPTHGWVSVCGWLGGWVGQWVGSGQMTKNLINLDLIEIIQFCFEDLLFVETPPPTHQWVGVWAVGCFSGSLGGGQVK